MLGELVPPFEHRLDLDPRLSATHRPTGKLTELRLKRGGLIGQAGIGQPPSMSCIEPLRFAG